MPSTLDFVEVHPHCGNHNNVERVRPLADEAEIRQAIVEPDNVGSGIEVDSSSPQFVDGLNRQHRVPHRCQRGSVAAHACPYIEDA